MLWKYRSVCRGACVAAMACALSTACSADSAWAQPAANQESSRPATAVSEGGARESEMAGDESKPSAETEAPEAVAAPHGSTEADQLRAYLRTQISELNHPSYRARQMARWRLEQYPDVAVEVMAESLTSVDYNTGAQLVDLLSELATHNNVTISVKSRETLKENANQISSVGRLADNALRAIADLQEEQAAQMLMHHGARIGLPEYLGFTLNARITQRTETLALWINAGFDNDGDAIEWIQFLKSVDTVFLEGSDIDSRHFRAVSRMSNVKNVKLKYVSLKPSDLLMFKQLASLELLELNYVDVGDEVLEPLAELPISQSLRLYGTRITQDGAEKLAQRLDGIEIYCGRGGYLGVSTHPSNTIVSGVIEGSGAYRAGIVENDELTAIDGVEIKDFSELRTELGKHLAGDRIRIRLKRRITPVDWAELEVDVILGEDPN